VNKVQYLAERDVSKVTCFQEMMAQVPKSSECQCFTVKKNISDHLKHLFASITPGTVYQPQLIKMLTMLRPDVPLIH